MRIYLIPGLGADRRMYNSLIAELGQGEVLEFSSPLPGEDLQQYVVRLADRIQKEEPFVLIGTSLGGIMCMELLQHVRPLKTIMLASVKNRKEIPWWIRLLRYVPVYRMLSGNWYKKQVIRMASRGLKGPLQQDAALIIAMAQSADPNWVKWGIDAVIKWNGSCNDFSNIIHLHGSKDPLFPLRYIQQAEVIRGGTHVMNMTRANEINQRIYQIITAISADRTTLH